MTRGCGPDHRTPPAGGSCRCGAVTWVPARRVDDPAAAVARVRSLLALYAPDVPIPPSALREALDPPTLEAHP